MTREEFLRDVTNFSDLKSFCYDMDIGLLDDVYDEGGRDAEINEWLCYNVRDYDWEDIRDRLAGIPTGDGWFYENGWDDWDVLDENEFESYKQEVLEYCDEASLWDDPDAENEDDPPYDDPSYASSIPSDAFPIPADLDFLSLLASAIP